MKYIIESLLDDCLHYVYYNMWRNILIVDSRSEKSINLVFKTLRRRKKQIFPYTVYRLVTFGTKLQARIFIQRLKHHPNFPFKFSQYPNIITLIKRLDRPVELELKRQMLISLKYTDVSLAGFTPSLSSKELEERFKIISKQYESLYE